MGKPASVNPHGTEIAGNPQTLIGTSVSQQQQFPRTQKIGILFQFRNRRRRNGRGRSDQHIHIRKSRYDVAARPFQFAAAFQQGFGADILAGANPAQSFRLIKFRTASDELRMKSIRLGALQGSVGRVRATQYRGSQRPCAARPETA